MIIRGGENIQPTEIENEICRHEAVQESFVLFLMEKAFMNKTVSRIATLLAFHLLV